MNPNLVSYFVRCFPFRDPDNVVLCILATDDEDVQDVALQIHFTLIQAFCCENDINILRVNNTRRLAEILGGGSGKQSGGEPMDLHCVLVTVSVALVLFPLHLYAWARYVRCFYTWLSNCMHVRWKNLLLLVLEHLINVHTAPPLHDFSGMSAEHCTLYLHTNSNLASWKAV